MTPRSARDTASEVWYRPEIDRDLLRRLGATGDWWGVVHVAAYFTLLGVLAGSVVLVWGSWWALGLLLVYGNVWTLGSISMEHEALHGHLLPWKRANRALAHVGGYMCGLEATRYRWTHFGHHSRTLATTEPADFETLTLRPVDPRSVMLNLLPFGGLVRPKKNFWYWHREVARNATGRLTAIARYGVREQTHCELVRNARVHVAIWVMSMVASVVVWSPIPALLLFLPPWYGSTFFLLCGLTQHSGLPRDVLDHRRNTRSFTTNPVLSFLYFGMQLHVEHHLFPNVPSRRLPELHHAIRDQLPAPRRGLVGAWREVWPALRRGYADPGFYLEIPVPPATQ